MNIVFYLTVLLSLVHCAGRRHDPDTQFPQPIPPLESPGATLPQEYPVDRKEVPTAVARIKRPVTFVFLGNGVTSFATIGAMKRIHDEKVPIEKIYVSGWPAAFFCALADSKSYNDLEWFSYQLNEGDFQRKRFNLFGNTFPTPTKFQDRCGQKTSKDFPWPLTFVPTPTHESAVAGEHFSELLPSHIFFPWLNAPEADSLPTRGLGLESLLSSSLTVFVLMYDDYLELLKSNTLPEKTKELRKKWAQNIDQEIQKLTLKTSLVERISLRASPFQFSQKRKAILSGYQAMTRLLKKLRK